MKADEIRAISLGTLNPAHSQNLFLQEVAAQMAEANELRREMLAVMREDFELRNDPAKFVQKLKEMAPTVGSFVGSAIAAAEDASTPAPTRPARTRVSKH